ncbi:caspase family protein [Ferroacidibacillus organovorans]|uniref:Peptidase C14 caspase domain-containing protein n=1 Tax=Ferroacidibacillus organovorans TaxID=1765683 RepID=A0A853K757_9BACL|nr:caspase family protein [Ferroacidibacillus organovorans]KYP79542.1 hypothetical protein AYJ22_14415 [Ferroacidibacillus organovorans]OAG91133.1 hypothetical protein AYW79_13880 [Ferroacidibacillus organovorans]
MKGSVQSRQLAVVIGVNDYGSAQSNLRYCSNDAEAFYESLVHYASYNSENMVLFSDGEHQCAKKPHYTDILSEVYSMCSNATESDSILLFFAGHGTRDDEDSYLLTQEFRPNVISESSIPMRKINDYFTQSKAKFKLRFFDACHSGRMGRRGLLNPSVDDAFIINAEGWATLAACKETQYAHEHDTIKHGVFSYYLVKGISGEASTNGRTVALDDLKLYVMNKTIDLTSKLGMEQTPVFAGEQSGSLIISRVRPEQDTALPVILLQIEKSTDEQLEPSPERPDALYSELNTLLSGEFDSRDYVAADQEDKMRRISSLTSLIDDWGKSGSKRYNETSNHAQMQSRFTSVEKLPLNRNLAEYLSNNTKVSEVIEWRFFNQTVTRYVKQTQTEVEERPSFGIGLSSQRQVRRYREVNVPHEEEVLAGIKVQDGYPVTDNSMLLQFSSDSHLVPHCGLVSTLIPNNFGAYLLCYFVCTKLGKELKELWDEDSFNVRHFSAVSFSEKYKAELKRELDQVYSQFLSYIIERTKARQMKLSSLGAVPGTSMVKP